MNSRARFQTFIRLKMPDICSSKQQRASGFVGLGTAIQTAEAGTTSHDSLGPVINPACFEQACGCGRGNRPSVTNLLIYLSPIPFSLRSQTKRAVFDPDVGGLRTSTVFCKGGEDAGPERQTYPLFHISAILAAWVGALPVYQEAQHGRTARAALDLRFRHVKILQAVNCKDVRSRL